MPRPARTIWVPRTYARRRHRSWMVSMCLAALGWTAWWVALIVVRIAPSTAEGMTIFASVASELCALLGLTVAALALRSRRTWILFVMIPLFANASLLVMPWLAGELVPPA